MGVARYYDASKNPDGAQIFGVPLGDLTDEEFDALPAHLQRSVDAAPFYRKTRPATGETRRALPRRESAERASAPGEPPHETSKQPSGDAGDKEG